MAFADVLIPMVRNLIGDTSDTPTYEDERIEQAIITAGLIVSQEYQFDADYIFDFVSSDISPDPTSSSTLDNKFIALVALKAACMLSLNTYQTAVGQGISVRDGDSAIDTTTGFGGYRDIINLGPCASYNKLLNTLISAKSMSGGKAVFGPYSHGNLPFDNYGNWRVSDFYDLWAYWR